MHFEIQARGAEMEIIHDPKSSEQTGQLIKTFFIRKMIAKEIKIIENNVLTRQPGH